MAGKGRPGRPRKYPLQSNVEDNVEAMSEPSGGEPVAEINKFSETEPLNGPQMEEKEEELPAAKFFAMSRCRYKSGEEIVTAEAGDEIVNPDKVDFQDLLDHGCVETFEPGIIQALLELKKKDSASKLRVAKHLGLV